MKQLKPFLLCATAALALCTAPLSVSAANSYAVFDGYAFDIEDGFAVIHEYSGESATPVIPNKLFRAPVTRIDSAAFFGQTYLTAVSFENAASLQSVGSNAFYGCSGLTSVTIPDTVTELGFGAFQNCSALAAVTLSHSMTAIAGQTFYGCTQLSAVTIPDSVQQIGAFAFGGCTALTEVWIPASVTEIDPAAFQGDDSAVLYCRSDSYAAAFAAAHEIPCVWIDGVTIGDTNGDGTVSIKDVTAIQRHLAELYRLTGAALLAADVNGDGVIDINDASHLQRYLAEYDVVLGEPSSV